MKKNIIVLILIILNLALLNRMRIIENRYKWVVAKIEAQDSTIDDVKDIMVNLYRGVAEVINE